jgi:Ca-activated chloride channel family protein
MVWRFLLILNLLTVPAWAIGQTADDYFHSGVQDYIFGDKKKATTEIYTGLRLYPTDSKLNAAAKLLQKKDPEDQNKSKNSQQNQEQNKDQQQQQQKQGQKSDQQKKDEQKARQEQAKKDQEKKQKEAQAKQDQQKDKQDENAEPTPASEPRMSEKEARQLLDAMKDDAKVLLFSPTNQPINTQRGKFKDW